MWGREFYLNTSLSQLAHELGVSKPALYRHFEHKQALLDAMTVFFYDDITAFIRAELAKAPADGDRERNAFKLIRAVALYYGRNANAFIFALVRVYDCQSGADAELEMKYRGVEIDMIDHNDPAWRQTMRMVFATITFFMADFHKQGKSFSNPPTETAIEKRIETIGEIIERGCGYTIQEINALDYERLETCVAETADTIKDDPLLKAVAQAVAEAGPWEASMEQVARYSGLSKSSLYGHFKNKEDMLRRFFENEFMRIIEFTRQGMNHSELPLERLYLGIFSIAVYLCSKPEILITLDRIRTRKLDANTIISKKNCHQEGGIPSEFLRLFGDISVAPLRSGESFASDAGKRCMLHWILFLLVGTLMRQDKAKDVSDIKVQDEDIRLLYRYVTLGIKGLNVYAKKID